LDKFSEVHESLSLDLARRLDPVCDRFEDAWLARLRIEDFLKDFAEPDRPALLRELLWLDLDYRARRGERPLAEEYRGRLPRYAALIDAIFGTDPPPVPLAGREAAVRRATGPETRPQRTGRPFPATRYWRSWAGAAWASSTRPGRSTWTGSSLSR
jgi:hypothetical protein